MATYSFMDVQAGIAGPGGAFSLGYGASVADEGITIDMAGDKNTMMIGADGNGMHSLHADRSGHITVRLLKVSPINQLLMALYDFQTLSSASHGLNTITVKQVASGDLSLATQCAFKKKPNLKYAKDGDILEWAWDALHVDSLLGQY